MKGNTQRIKDAPCEGNIMLCRKISALSKGNTLSDKAHKKMKRSIGVGFSKLAFRMSKLGYYPKIKEFPSQWSSMSFGKSRG